MKRSKPLKYYYCCYCKKGTTNKYYQQYKSFCNEDCWKKYKMFTATELPFLTHCNICDEKKNITYHISSFATQGWNGKGTKEYNVYRYAWQSSPFLLKENINIYKEFSEKTLGHSLRKAVACEDCYKRVPKLGFITKDKAGYMGYFRSTERNQQPIKFICQGCKKRISLKTYVELKKEKKKWKVCSETCGNVFIISKLGG
jgi:uncharacterized protein YlaI